MLSEMWSKLAFGVLDRKLMRGGIFEGPRHYGGLKIAIVVDPVAFLADRISSRRMDHNRFTTRPLIRIALEKRYNVMVGYPSQELVDRADILIVKDTMPVEFDGINKKDIWFFQSGMPAEESNYLSPSRIFLIGGKHQRLSFQRRYSEAHIHKLGSALPDTITAKRPYFSNIERRSLFSNAVFITSQNILHRGGPEIVKAINARNNTENPPMTLNIIGDTRSRADDRGFEAEFKSKHIRFRGFFNWSHEKNRRLLTAQDFQLHLSKSEGVSGSVLLGLFFGLPAVVSKESYIDGMDEYLFEVERSSLSVQRGIDKLSQNVIPSPSLRRAISHQVTLLYSVARFEHTVMAEVEKIDD